MHNDKVHTKDPCEPTSLTETQLQSEHCGNGKDYGDGEGHGGGGGLSVS